MIYLIIGVVAVWYIVSLLLVSGP